MNFEKFRVELFICKTHRVRKTLANIELGYRLYSKHSWIQTFNSLKKVFKRNSDFEISGLAKKISDVKTLVI